MFEKDNMTREEKMRKERVEGFRELSDVDLADRLFCVDGGLFVDNLNLLNTIGKWIKEDLYGFVDEYGFLPTTSDDVDDPRCELVLEKLLLELKLIKSHVKFMLKNRRKFVNDEYRNSEHEERKENLKRLQN